MFKVGGRVKYGAKEVKGTVIIPGEKKTTVLFDEEKDARDVATAKLEGQRGRTSAEVKERGEKMIRKMNKEGWKEMSGASKPAAKAKPKAKTDAKEKPTRSRKRPAKVETATRTRKKSKLTPEPEIEDWDTDEAEVQTPRTKKRRVKRKRTRA